MQKLYYISVNQKGQVTIPKALRDLLNIESGMKLPVLFEGDAVVIRKSEVKNLAEIRKSFLKEITKKAKPHSDLKGVYAQLPKNSYKRD